MILSVSSRGEDTVQSLSSSAPSSVPTTTISTEPSSLTATPSISFESKATEKPTTNFNYDDPLISWCANDPDFFVETWEYDPTCNRRDIHLPCEDHRVRCPTVHESPSYGNLGWATDYCCKCKFECTNDGHCSPWDRSRLPDDHHSIGCADPTHFYVNDQPNNGGILLTKTTETVILVLVICGVAVAAKIFYNHQRDRPARRQIQRIMAARRREQREHYTHGLTEEERNTARCEQFKTKFYSQVVLPDKSNITADSLRIAASNRPDEERPEHGCSRSSAKDECCICLECYSEGETICASMDTKCNHVFHEGCIIEWLKTNDHCPLCRVELLKD